MSTHLIAHIWELDFIHWLVETLGNINGRILFLKNSNSKALLSIEKQIVYIIVLEFTGSRGIFFNKQDYLEDI